MKSQGPVRLSEAIRKGIKTTLPLSDGVLSERDEEGNLHACALMAAHIGNGGNPGMQDNEIWDSLKATWPELNSVLVKDPKGWNTQQQERSLVEAIWMRNDHMRAPWTRERIADWLEGLGY